MSAFREALNPEQYAAVTYTDGPSLVIAGAGSGKTRVLTYKIAYLLQQGAEPWSILALTFTNKAAREMNERIGQICTDLSAHGMWSGTFHSLFARLLRMEAAYTGIPADFSIYDASDSRSLLKNIVKELGLDEKVYKPSRVAGRISEAKNRLILPSAYAADASIQRRDYTEGMQSLHKIYESYQRHLRAAKALDFDDLLLHTFLLLRDHTEVRERYKARFRYILVDEYQDTNLAQHRILSLLTDPTSNICVVGDDAQSIYSFRGADISNILHFQEQYPTARIFKLECNYRSTRMIVEAANCIIANNKHQIPKKVYAAEGEGEPITVFRAKTDKEEATRVAAHIARLRRKGIDYSEMALLYRTNAQSRSFEEVFQKNAIPYRIYGGLSFYQRKEVKDVLAYFRLIANTDDEEAFRRVVNYPARGIGSTSLSKLQVAAARAGVSLWEAASHPDRYEGMPAAAAAKKLMGFCALIEGFRAAAQTTTASALAKKIVEESGIARDLLNDSTAEGQARRENVDELIGSITGFEQEQLREQGHARVGLTDFLSTVSLLTDTDVQEDGVPRVTLMTVHAAKGLEFEAVFVTGMEDGLFPNANAQLYPREMEEERRLFYVAVTRAKRHCFLSYAETRFKYGSLQISDPSCFIDEIDDCYLNRQDARGTFRSFAPQPESRYSSRRETFEDNPFEADRPWGQSQRSYDRKPWSPPEPTRVAPPAPPSGFKRVTPPRTSSASAGTGSAPRATSAAVREKLEALRIGMRIAHERFGNGTVVGMEGSDDSAKVSVNFDQAGAKTLLVKFARYTIIG